MTQKQIAASIPHEYRKMILLDWIPNAQPHMGNEAFKLLFEAYFIYVDPNGVKKDDCPICLNNILKTWKHLQPFLVEAEQQYNALQQI